MKNSPTHVHVFSGLVCWNRIPNGSSRAPSRAARMSRGARLTPNGESPATMSNARAASEHPASGRCKMTWRMRTDNLGQTHRAHGQPTSAPTHEPNVLVIRSTIEVNRAGQTSGRIRLNRSEDATQKRQDHRPHEASAAARPPDAQEQAPWHEQ